MINFSRIKLIENSSLILCQHIFAHVSLSARVNSIILKSKRNYFLYLARLSLFPKVTQLINGRAGILIPPMLLFEPVFSVS